ncbi:MAG: ABC transporter ATP-binding protein [Bacillota bacterium]|nr:ABC transporter ATP-binding protein [Bacillota bacterium]
MSIIKVNNLFKTYGSGEAEVRALQGVSLTIEKGEMIAIMGASGSGKSTLLNILGLLDKPTDGQYYLKSRPIMTFNSKEMAVLRNQIFGFIVQDFALVDRYSVYRNVMIPLTYSKKPIHSKKSKIEDVLSQLGILDKKNVLALKLSGGQRQRVAIARAIVNDPDIILADEPTGALDSKTGNEVISIFKKLNNAGKTVIIVTHNSDVASSCHRIIEIRDGKIA